MIQNGKNMVVYLPGDGMFGEVGSLYPIACDRSCTLQTTSEFIETTVKDNGIWKTYLPTYNSAQISGDGLVDFCKVMNISSLQYYQFNRKPVVVKMLLDVEAPDEGEVLWQGTGYFQQLQHSGQVNQGMSFSYTILITGGITIDNSFSCGTGGVTPPPPEDVKQPYRLQFLATTGQTTYQNDALIGAELLEFTIANQCLYEGNGDYQMAGLNSSTGTITWNYEAANGNECIILYKK